tara:strand:+ start:6433 stop:7353 length:921 start_codon:yes stop_codon:yes gene_type:complete
MAEDKKVDNKRIFEVDGKKYAVIRPTSKYTEDATMEYNRVFSKALQNGALLRERLDQFMRQQKLWDDDREAQYTDLLTQINDREKKLSQGGIKLSEAKDIALEMRGVRAALQALISQRNALDVNTAQGQAENARFNFLLAACLVYNESGERIYSSVEDYSEKQAEGDTIGVVGAEYFANMYFGLEKDYEKKLPENKFLQEYKFVNDELQLINKEGLTVDWEGKLVDEYGKYVNEEGDYVDYEGNPLSEEGLYDFEAKPFLDEEGNPIVDESKEKPVKKEEASDEKEEPKKRRGRPKKEQKTEAVEK